MEVRAEVNQTLVTLTTSPVLQSQTIIMLTEDVERKTMNLEAVIFAHGISAFSPSNPVSHKKTLLRGKW